MAKHRSYSIEFERQVRPGNHHIELVLGSRNCNNIAGISFIRSKIQAAVRRPCSRLPEEFACRTTSPQ